VNSARALSRIAVISALVAALGLAGCGRKGGLDPPPETAAVVAVPLEGEPPPAIGPDGQPVAPKASQRRWTPLDWLVN
jgi:predicted small lipoprotein YifL